jgi:periplasmic divalent cation tolerance protein
MPNNNFVELVLTCANQQEAETIADALLGQKLIACAKFVPVNSRFQWNGSIDTNDEILVLMETAADKFEAIEAIVANLHSYDTFVLKSMPISQISKGAAKWLTESLE